MYIIYGVLAVVGSMASAAGGIIYVGFYIIESLDDDESTDEFFPKEDASEIQDLEE